MSKNFPVNGFEWVEKLSKFDERLIKNYDEDIDKDIFLNYMLSIQKVCLVFIAIYHFYLKERKSNKCNKLVCDFYDKKTIKTIKTLKQAPKHGSISKKVHRLI